MSLYLQPDPLLCWLITTVPVALLLHLGLSALPVQSCDFGVYCSLRNVCFRLKLDLWLSTEAAALQYQKGGLAAQCA